LFLICTGARVAEALDLKWDELDLVGARATLWTKASSRRRRHRRVVELPPRLIDTLQALPHREGPVFTWETKRSLRKRDGQPKRIAAYADRDREGGGQIKKGFAGAVKRAGLDSAITPHSLRHTYASWHYALHRNPLKLMVDGAWSSLKLVERYAHLLPEGFEDAIRVFQGWPRMDTKTEEKRASV
jgi:integrase